jgi:hypothetical protein
MVGWLDGWKNLKLYILHLTRRDAFEKNPLRQTKSLKARWNIAKTYDEAFCQKHPKKTTFSRSTKQTNYDSLTIKNNTNAAKRTNRINRSRAIGRS